MTAEVSILNSAGVALAADSAVSIGSEANKIWTSADKLFHLSQAAPVGIMVFGNANLLGIPWETIVKEFRNELAKTRYDYLEQYAEKFFNFLDRNRILFPKASQDLMIEGLIYSLFLHVREQMERRITEEAKINEGIDENDLIPILDKAVKDRLKYVKKQKRIKGIGEKNAEKIRKRYTPIVRQIRSEVFGNLPISAMAKRNIASLAHEMITREYFSSSKSGVVVAGFGQKEALPSLYGYEVEEMALNVTRRKPTYEQHVTLENKAVIIPFAQREIVMAFLNGIDVSIAKHMRKSTEGLFKGAISSIMDEVGKVNKGLMKTLKAAVEPEIQSLINKLFQDWEDQTSYHWRPIIEIASSLPKDELAGMAESLVNLTKFKRRITPERETVGGPIDVAIITKKLSQNP